MNCHFKTKYQVTPRCSHRAFSLPEAMAALMILSFMAVGVLTIVNRSMASIADSVLKMRAFEVARNNMEMLLASKSLSQTIDYGYSELYPQIEWENRVETFYEPVSSRLWLQAICSAIYSDQKGEEQKIELTSWITEISKDDLLKLLKQEQKEYELTELIKTIAEAAQFAEVEPETIEEWLDNGMPVVEEGDFEDYFIKDELELYKKTGGNPSEQERAKNLLERQNQDNAERASEGDNGEQLDPDESQPQSDPEEPEFDLSKIPREFWFLFDE